MTLKEKISYIVLIILLIPINTIAQNKKESYSLTINTIEKANMAKHVEFVTIAITKNKIVAQGGTTGMGGSVTFNKIPAGLYTIKASLVGYENNEQTYKISSDTIINIAMVEREKKLKEVVVTAKESKGATSKSIIDRDAMSHLQPSSITDVMQMLPGAITKDPDMSKANSIKIREAQGDSPSAYQTTSLGTSFVIDGVPINTNANMQYTSSAWDTSDSRQSTGKGVDMRSVSTDDIEKVEVVRGIASVEYGDLTSGLVNIVRKSGASKLEARFKADMQSQLFYIGKGFKAPKNWILNLGVDYLDAKIDPRNSRENYKRVTGSIRASKLWVNDNYVLSIKPSINYNGTFEADKNDPDLTINNTKDYYSSYNHKISLSNILSLKNKKKGLFRTFELTTSASYELSKIHQEATVASSQILPLNIATESGEYYVNYVPAIYDTEMDIKGNPFTAYMKAKGLFLIRTGKISNVITAGADWSMSKNYGEGRVFDVTRPISSSSSLRPRAFSDIPAEHNLSFFIEDVTRIPINSNMLELMVGLRETQMMNLGSQYHLNWHPYLDPRANIKWAFPTVSAFNKPLSIEISGGIGWHTKMPIMAYLFPDKTYYDQVQLNYYHNNADYRSLNVKTFVDDATNYNLEAARNLKWEVRGDISYANHRLSVTYFREDMKNGFRSASQIMTYYYRTFDASDYNPIATQHAPRIEELPFVNDTIVTPKTFTSNGSRTFKQGIEFNYNSPRFAAIMTRLTISGAWFKTTYQNSQPIYYKPSIKINNKTIQYVGIYNDDDGYERQSFNTNFIFDTDIPRIRLGFSLTIQNMWFTKSRSMYKNGVPFAYVDNMGVTHNYTEESAHDGILQNLIRIYNEDNFTTTTVPIATTINLKATKKIFRDKLFIAVFANNLINILPDYKINGITFRRYAKPYFGMEINLNF